MFKKEFDEFSDIINIDNFERICMDQYPYYIDTVIDFREKKSDVYLIVKEYGQNIINEIFRNDNLRDRVLSDSDKKIRHEK